MENINSVFSGTTSLLAGNFVGAISNRLSQLIDSRVTMVRHKDIGVIPLSLVEKSVSLIFQTGLLTTGSNIVTKGLPWITEDAGSLVLYILGIAMTSTMLPKTLQQINHFVLVGSEFAEYGESTPVEETGEEKAEETVEPTQSNES